MITYQRRAVITGTGVVSALGDTPAVLWHNLAADQCAIRRMPEWQAELGNNVLAAPVELDTQEVKQIERKFRRSMGRVALFAALAAKQAVKESGLDAAVLNSGRAGCIISSSMGSGSSIDESISLWNSGARDEIPALQFFKCASHTAALNVANMFGINGIQLSPCSACASSLQSIGAAMDAVRWGKQEVVIAGGTEEITPMAVGSFAQLFALATDNGEAPETASRPFDAARRGLVCGEGAGVIIVEEYEHAVRRGAPILGELVGYATNCSGRHVSQSERAAIEKCLRLALEDAQIPSEDVDYINAHATGTIQGDGEEAAALRTVFGNRTPVSSLKGHLGHTLGASGGIELVAVLEMMKHGWLLPTLNLNIVGEECSGLAHLMKTQPIPPRMVVKNGIAFGGINAVLIIKNI